MILSQSNGSYLGKFSDEKVIDIKGDFTLEVCGKYFEAIPKELIPTASKLAAEAGRYVMNMI